MHKSQTIGASGDSMRLEQLVCFSHLRWDFVYQRPQQLLSRCARHTKVLFIEEPIYSDVESPSHQVLAPAHGVIVATLFLPQATSEAESIEAQRAFVDDLLHQHLIENFVAWYYTPMALSFTAHLTPAVTVYDCMDELAAFQGAPAALVQMERKLFDRAEIVFTGGASLYAAKKKQHRQVYLFPSSVDVSHFAAARDSKACMEPADQAAIGRPRIGFFGVLDERLDLVLLQKVAALRSQWQFILVGPVVKISSSELPRRENIYYLGQQSYQDLPNYIAGWDLAMMPFASNDSTRFISPTKTPEYLAAGKPVVSTPIADVVTTYGSAQLVEIASDPEQFVKAMDAAATRDTAEWLKRVDTLLAKNSWDKTWARMWELVEQCHSNATVRGTEAVNAGSSNGLGEGDACSTISL